MQPPQFWYPEGEATFSQKMRATFLRPLGLIYGELVVRRIAHTQAKRAPLPLICVGNFTLGGAGKTPTSHYIATRLAAIGARPAILLRGFGGTHRAPARRVIATQDRAEVVGDEALMLARDFPTYIGADRLQSAHCAHADGATILIKDDGFQNPYLDHDFNLLVVDAASGLGNENVFPSGPLREPLAHALTRTHALLQIDSTHYPSHPSLERFPKEYPRFYGTLRALDPPPKRAFAFCGIGRPQKFIAPLASAGCLAGHRIFADHHFYSDHDAQTILDAAHIANATPLTTAKDIERLKGAPPHSARATLARTTQISKIALILKEADGFDAQLKKLLPEHKHRIDVPPLPENSPVKMHPR